jgi:diamine N-acetyltransferase
VSDHVGIREITKDNLGAILKLEVAPEQDKFVASNAVSLAQAHFNQDHAWYRAIYAGDRAVGFAMFSLEEGETQAYLWRFMVAEAEQGKGYGRRGLELLLEAVREKGYRGALLSFVDEPGSPEPFYARLGFARNGKVTEGETEMELSLSG